LGQQLEPFFEPALGQRFAQSGDQRSRGDEQSADALLASFHPERDRQVALPDSGKNNHILRSFHAR